MRRNFNLDTKDTKNEGVVWQDDWDNHETTPNDGSWPICFWWEDMRPNELRILIQGVYERGYERGLLEREK